MGSSQSKWVEDNIPSQNGRVAVVTGANSGIGLETARALVNKGATVVLACRSAERGQAAVKEIVSAEEKGSGSATFMQLDLSDQQSVKDFSEKFSAEHSKLHLLINNAGVMVPPESKTKQGIELMFGVNHIGHFLLTRLLVPQLIAASEDDGGSRVVTVSSTAANFSPKFDEATAADYNAEKRGYGSGWTQYGLSKLSNQLFTLALTRRLQAAGHNKVIATMAHPGYTATNLQVTTSARLFNWTAMSPAQGALPTLRAAVDPESKPGQYYGPDGLGQVRGYPVSVPALANATVEEDQERLWKLSERLIDMDFVVPAKE